MSYKNTAYILLGGNINPRKSFLQKAEEKISIETGKILAKSKIYETQSWGFEADNYFLNQLLKVGTDLSAQILLSKLLMIETEMGRVRGLSENYISRTIDADIIYFNNEIIDEKDLIVPHPRLHLRKFVLQPLCEIAPEYVHPLFKKTNRDLLAECQDESIVLTAN